MTQSKKDDTFTINLDDTYGTTTTYWAGDSVTDITVTPSDGTFTISDYLTDTIDLSNITITDTDYITLGKDDRIDPSKVERMCDHYPSLEKAWRNFKSIYDMVEQDYKGNHEDLDDDIPF